MAGGERGEQLRHTMRPRPSEDDALGACSEAAVKCWLSSAVFKAQLRPASLFIASDLLAGRHKYAPEFSSLKPPPHHAARRSALLAGPHVGDSLGCSAASDAHDPILAGGSAAAGGAWTAGAKGQMCERGESRAGAPRQGKAGARPRDALRIHHARLRRMRRHGGPTWRRVSATSGEGDAQDAASCDGRRAESAGWSGGGGRWWRSARKLAAALAASPAPAGPASRV
jgi:hypothetical protein